MQDNGKQIHKNIQDSNIRQCPKIKCMIKVKYIGHFKQALYFQMGRCVHLDFLIENILEYPVICQCMSMVNSYMTYTNNGQN